ncbi:unnamed protein product [Chrysodeixis includens]|uniref:MADF domain-containing protein n=1 Tax=Chrysodeixis includens TaxID=689277 RepID=A0A9N8Q0G8_CHRIL|nr:unnamed protein product [Chrysodeixis includens]
MSWNNESELNFIEIYQMEPVLWDPQHKFHRDKKCLHDAWIRINEQTGYTVPKLKKKRDSLMATYRSHLRKIKNSFKSGAGLDEVYKPVWFAFNLMNSFLEQLCECKITRNTESQVFLSFLLNILFISNIYQK